MDFRAFGRDGGEAFHPGRHVFRHRLPPGSPAARATFAAAQHVAERTLRPAKRGEAFAEAGGRHAAFYAAGTGGGQSPGGGRSTASAGSTGGVPSFQAWPGL